MSIGNFNILQSKATGKQISVDDIVDQRDDISRRLLFADTVNDLSTLDPSTLKDGQQVSVSGSYFFFKAESGEWEASSAVSVKAYGAVGDGVADDTLAIQSALDNHNHVLLSGSHKITASLFCGNQRQILEGIAGGESRAALIVSGDFPALKDESDWIEGREFKNFSIRSEVPGQGIGFYSPPSRYLAISKFSGVSFEASLRKCMESNLILCTFDFCDFGTYGSTEGVTHAHIESYGQPLNDNSSLTTNINTFTDCRFRNARGVDHGSIFENGYMQLFKGCDIEVNNCTLSTMRFNGILGVQFLAGTWFERCTGTSLISFGMDSVGNLQGSQGNLIDGCWLKLEYDNTHIAIADTDNFSIAINNTQGTGFGSRSLFEAGGFTDPRNLLRSFINNRLVGYTSSDDKLGSVNLHEPISAKYVAKAGNPEYTFEYSNGASQGTIIGSGSDSSSGEIILSPTRGYTRFRHGSTEVGLVNPTTIAPGRDNAQGAGNLGLRYTQVYAATGTIGTSDEREKQQIREVSAKEMIVAQRLKGSIRAFKWDEAVERKGDGARIHFGVMAQEVGALFEEEGLDPHRYALFCYDEWDDEFDGDGKKVVEKGNRYGVRYDQLLAFMISAI